MRDDPIAELTAIADVLDRASITWWIDSGTLLGLYRDGELFDLSRDKDFDIGAWIDDRDRIAAALGEFRQRGYRVGRRHFAGAVVKYWLKPQRGRPAKQIDIKLHRRFGDLAVCPGALVLSSEQRPVLRHAARFMQLGVGALWRRRFRHSWSVPGLAVTFSVTSWQIPTGFVETCERVTLGGVSVPVPSPVEEYLSFRYGDWRTPTADWVTHRDDGGLRLAAPDVTTGW